MLHTILTPMKASPVAKLEQQVVLMLTSQKAWLLEKKTNPFWEGLTF